MFACDRATAIDPQSRLARAESTGYCAAQIFFLIGEASLTVRNRNLAALLGCALLCLSAAPVAQVRAQSQEIPPDFKGVVGLGLIGAELGMVIPAIAGVNDTWAYLVFPAVGAIGGGLAGYFLLEANDQTEISIAMLGIGMALVIPATVLTLSLTAYDPDDEMPATEEARFDVNAIRTRREQARARAGAGLLRMADGGLWLGAPAVGPVATVNASGAPTVRFGVSDFQLALVSGTF